MGDRWDVDRSRAWGETSKHLRGVNYLPRTAVNSTEMWQADTFDDSTISKELDWASEYGYTSLRVFLQYVVWNEDSAGLVSRFERLLSIAEARGITVMPILFDDCAFDVGRAPYTGPQDDPVPGVHNSRWVPSPGPALVVDQKAWGGLEKYVHDIVGRFAGDERVIAWDLYNEPGNGGMDETSMPLVEATFEWARTAAPTQPLTAGFWRGGKDAMEARLMELSDVMSFHSYAEPDEHRSTVELATSHGRPALCTEWLCRNTNNTFASILPILDEYDVGWYHWGLVAGRTQTYLAWTSRAGDPPPDTWQHDVLRADGTPYDAAEMKLVKARAGSSRE